MPDSNLIKLRKKTYLKMIENSVGARLFNSLFVKFKDTGSGEVQKQAGKKKLSIFAGFTCHRQAVASR